MSSRANQELFANPVNKTELDKAVDRGVSHLLSLQNEDGYWWGELESNVTITSEHLFLTHILDVSDKQQGHKIANYLLGKQRDDGTWANWYSGPADLSTTIEAYFALKMAGTPIDLPEMKKAREFILNQGGVEESRIFTKIWLAMLGQWDWRGTPMMPPELILLPNWFPINIYEFACWARGTIVPMTIIQTLKPTFPVPSWARIDELFVNGKENVDLSLPKSRSVWGRFFSLGDKLLRIYDRFPRKCLRERAIRKAKRWIISRQEEDGSWGGIQPPWVYSLIALHALGYKTDHPVIRKGLSGFYGAQGFAIEEEDTFRLQSCLSPVWDTGLAMLALEESGTDSVSSALGKAAVWLIGEQIFTGGDWQVKCSAPPGGWAFEFANDVYPDVDDAAVVIMALLDSPISREKKHAAIRHGLGWLLAMQSNNGGWGAFDRNNTRTLLREIPFADFGELVDPPSVDVTGHVVELLGRLGYRKGFGPLDRALAYLRREQESDGAWFGRWGVNLTYGIGSVLPALAEVGEDMESTHVQRAIDWLVGHQNDDGGWGEQIEGYNDPDLRGKGPSTASQTAWALIALIAAEQIEHSATRLGIEYLIDTQEENGGWDEPQFTGTGFPTDFMINYHLYRDIFPMIALSRYKNMLENKHGSN